MCKAFWPVLSVLLLSVVAACSPATPPPPPPELLAPRQLATVIISPTPVGTPIVPPTRTPAPSPTVTPVPPTVTPSPTPYAGIFMGDGSAPLILPTASSAAVVEVTLVPPTSVPGVSPPEFPTATPPFAIPGAALPAGAVNTTCTVDPAPVFLSAYTTTPEVSAAIGCPLGPPESAPMAEQRFERGVMFWRSTGEIYALAAEPVNGAANLFWRVEDRWQEGQPQSDPSMVAPPDLIQPIRGFGLAWRSNGEIRNALGWGVTEESGYTGTWQSFERGAMFTAQSGAVYALIPADAPVTRGQYIGPLF